MSKSVLWIVMVGVVVTAAVAAMFLVPAWFADAPPPVTIDTLEAWVELSRRPGFELLDEQAVGDYFVAVYRTEADEVAFCYRWRGEGEPPSTSLAVRDADGNDLQDAGRRNVTTALNPTGPLPGGGFVHGMVVPIRGDHEGAVGLDFRDDVGDPGAVPAREVYRQTVRWPR